MAGRSHARSTRSATNRLFAAMLVASRAARRSIARSGGAGQAGGEVVAARVELGRPQVSGGRVHIDVLRDSGRTHVDVMGEGVRADQRPVVASRCGARHVAGMSGSARALWRRRGVRASQVSRTRRPG